MSRPAFTNGFGGESRLNLEALVRGIDAAEAGSLPVIREMRGAHAAIAAVTHVKSYWEHEPGGGMPAGTPAYHHNLAVYGWTSARPTPTPSDRRRRRSSVHRVA